MDRADNARIVRGRHSSTIIVNQGNRDPRIKNEYDYGNNSQNNRQFEISYQPQSHGHAQNSQTQNSQTHNSQTHNQIHQQANQTQSYQPPQAYSTTLPQTLLDDIVDVPDDHVLYLTNLHPDTTNEDLLQKFSFFGEILSIKVLSNKTGFICFSDAGQAKNASLELSHKKFYTGTGKSSIIHAKLVSENPKALTIKHLASEQAQTNRKTTISSKVEQDYDPGQALTSDQNWAQAVAGQKYCLVGDLLPGITGYPFENVVYVTNLHSTVTSFELSQIFNGFGDILACKVCFNEKLKTSQCRGLIVFKDANQAMDSVNELDKTQIHLDRGVISRLSVVCLSEGDRSAEKTLREELKSSRKDENDTYRMLHAAQFVLYVGNFLEVDVEDEKDRVWREFTKIMKFSDMKTKAPREVPDNNIINSQQPADYHRHIRVLKTRGHRRAKYYAIFNFPKRRMAKDAEFSWHCEILPRGNILRSYMFDYEKSINLRFCRERDERSLTLQSGLTENYDNMDILVTTKTIVGKWSDFLLADDKKIIKDIGKTCRVKFSFQQVKPGSDLTIIIVGKAVYCKNACTRIDELIYLQKKIRDSERSKKSRNNEDRTDSVVEFLKNDQKGSKNEIMDVSEDFVKKKAGRNDETEQAIDEFIQPPRERGRRGGRGRHRKQVGEEDRGQASVTLAN